ncbi:MAG: uroporphyrinogen decarboxylase family protein [Promethearchaeota archaeon]|jgi:uroporphyrinogen decarboxylase
MDVHERVIKTIEHDEPDRVPTLAQVFEYSFTKKVAYQMGIEEPSKKSLAKDFMYEAAIHMGFDSIWYHFDRIRTHSHKKPEVPEEILMQYNIKSYNEWAQYYDGEWYRDGVLKTPELLKDWISYINTWTPSGEIHFKSFKKLYDKYLQRGLVTIPTGGSVAFASWAMIGINRFAYMVRKHFSLVKDLAKALGRITKELQNCLFEKGVDLVFICDDWALKGSTIYNPNHWNEIVSPVYKDLAKNAHKHGAKLLIHSDGDVSETIPFLINSGVDGIDPLEYESGMRLGPLKKEFGANICLIGNISATYALTYGSKETVINDTKQAIQDAAVGGGFILGAGSDILGTCKYDNVKAMIDTVKKYGSYPIRRI